MNTDRRALDLVAGWPVDHAAAAVVAQGDLVDSTGAHDHEFRLASISKPVAAWACLVAVEEAIIDLHTPVGQPGCTLEHLLAHAGGYPFDGPDPIARPERTRIYSNTGIEMAADALAVAARMTFDDYLREAVLAPLAMTATELRGSPAHQMWSTVADVVAFIREIQSPQLISAETAAEAIRPHFPTLGGIVPGVGRYDSSPWGLGFEIKGTKVPHWTGAHNSASTFGHFGGAGTMMWIDPTVGIGVVALTDRAFDEWADDALRLWPELSDAVLAEFAQASEPTGGGW
jgi:CubicO group peptidase (beta-lactamase class C family)